MLDFNYDYYITPEARLLLAKPAGELLTDSIEVNIKKVKNLFEEKSKLKGKKDDYTIICVGDVVSEAYLGNKELLSHLKMCVIDGHTKRKKYSFENYKDLFKKVTLHNPPSLISGNACQQLQSLLQSEQKHLVLVDGEEDLLVIPLVLYAPENTFIIYGQPPVTDVGMNIPSGMVIITIDEDIKRKINTILEKFDKRERNLKI